MTYDFSPLLLTFKLALVATICLFILGVPIAYFLSHSRFRLKPVLETFVSLPLVLPPTVIGFYLLVAFSPAHFLGSFFEKYLGVRLAFSFAGLVVASIIYGLPFMVQPLTAGFSHLSPSLAEASTTLGKSKWTTLVHVELPNMKANMLAGIILTFAHCIGEFGVVLMIGGNIPGVTRVASIAIYDEVEAMHYGTANMHAMILFAISFTILLFFNIFQRMQKHQGDM